MSDPTVASFRKESDLAVVRVEVERLDENTTRTLQAMIIEEASRNAALPFVIDFSNVAFLSSLSLAALVRAAKEFEHRSQRLIVAALQPAVREVIEVTRLTRFLEVQENLPAAFDAIRRRLPPRLSRDEDDEAATSA